MGLIKCIQCNEYTCLSCQCDQLNSTANNSGCESLQLNKNNHIYQFDHLHIFYSKRYCWILLLFACFSIFLVRDSSALPTTPTGFTTSAGYRLILHTPQYRQRYHQELLQQHRTNILSSLQQYHHRHHLHHRALDNQKTMELAELQEYLKHFARYYENVLFECKEIKKLNARNVDDGDDEVYIEVEKLDETSYTLAELARCRNNTELKNVYEDLIGEVKEMYKNILEIEQQFVYVNDQNNKESPDIIDHTTNATGQIVQTKTLMEGLIKNFNVQVPDQQLSDVQMPDNSETNAKICQHILKFFQELYAKLKAVETCMLQMYSEG